MGAVEGCRKIFWFEKEIRDLGEAGEAEVESRRFRSCWMCQWVLGG